MDPERRQPTDAVREPEAGDVAVPVNAAVAANVLSGAPAQAPDVELEQDN
jgi:hypothetical protein